jgi:hypothetical protein
MNTENPQENKTSTNQNSTITNMVDSLTKRISNLVPEQKKETKNIINEPESSEPESSEPKTTELELSEIEVGEQEQQETEMPQPEQQETEMPQPEQQETEMPQPEQQETNTTPSYEVVLPSRPIEEIPIIQNLKEESVYREKSSSTKKKRRCPNGKHRSKKNRCKKLPPSKSCPPHKFRSAVSHRCRKKCSKNNRYSKSKKRCIRKKTK